MRAELPCRYCGSFSIEAPEGADAETVRALSERHLRSPAHLEAMAEIVAAEDEALFAEDEEVL